MLQAKTIDLTNRIVAAKLITGEEIIAKVTQVGDVYLTLSRPLTMVMIAGESEEVQGMVAFAPWMLGLPDETNVSLHRDRIIFVAEARADASEQYKNAVGEPVVQTPRQAVAPAAVATRGRR